MYTIYGLWGMCCYAFSILQNLKALQIGLKKPVGKTAVSTRSSSEVLLQLCVIILRFFRKFETIRPALISKHRYFQCSEQRAKLKKSALSGRQQARRKQTLSHFRFLLFMACAQ